MPFHSLKNFAGIFLGWLCLCACTNTFAQKGGGNAKQSLLWEISGNGLAQPSYLYGTIHSKDLRCHALTDSVYACLNRSKALALEIVFDQKDQLNLLNKMFMQGTTLSNLYSTTDYTKVKTFLLKKMGYVAAVFKVDHIKPIFLATLLGEFDTSNQKYPQSELPLDVFLQKWGSEHQKILIGIETIDEQMNAIDNIPLAEQANILLQQVNNDTQNALLMEQMTRHYIQQNLDSLQIFYDEQKNTMATQGMTNYFDQSLILSRNRVMAARIDSIIRRQSTFAAVGALHLTGQQGLIELLRQRGFSVQSVYQKTDGYIVQPELKHFEIWFPKKPDMQPMRVFSDTLQQNEPQTAWLYSYVDTTQNTYYSLAEVSIETDTLPKSDSLFYDLMSERLLLKEGTYIVTQGNVNINGIEGHGGEIDMNYMPGMSMRFWMAHIKNKVYLLSFIGKIEDIYALPSDRFFSSFRVRE